MRNFVVTLFVLFNALTIQTFAEEDPVPEMNREQLIGLIHKPPKCDDKVVAEQMKKFKLDKDLLAELIANDCVDNTFKVDVKKTEDRRLFNAASSNIWDKWEQAYYPNKINHLKEGGTLDTGEFYKITKGLGLINAVLGEFCKKQNDQDSCKLYAEVSKKAEGQINELTALNKVNTQRYGACKTYREMMETQKEVDDEKAGAKISGVVNAAKMHEWGLTISQDQKLLDTFNAGYKKKNGHPFDYKVCGSI